MRGTKAKALREQAEAEQAFLNDPAMVDPFIKLSAMVIAASEELEKFRKHHDLGAGDMVKEYMDRIIQEANNVKVDISVRNFAGGV